MMFTREDFQIHSVEELLQFLPIAVLLLLVGPFLLAAYGLGFVMDKTGWLASE